MPKCSSSYTALGASRHMNSMASWSPSQSDPLTVSYMCQYQLSSLMLPSEALTPPCAATVCERVGNTLESTATLRPARASCSEARMPEPPAPTITTSNFRLGRFAVAVMASEPPENLNSPAQAGHEPDDGECVQDEAQARRLGVVHPDVSHADPGVIDQRHEHNKGQALHPLAGKDAGPGFVANRPGGEDHLCDHD